MKMKLMIALIGMATASASFAAPSGGFLDEASYDQPDVPAKTHADKQSFGERMKEARAKKAKAPHAVKAKKPHKPRAKKPATKSDDGS
jgi:hypothetical protein